MKVLRRLSSTSSTFINSLIDPTVVKELRRQLTEFEKNKDLERLNSFFKENFLEKTHEFININDELRKLLNINLDYITLNSGNSESFCKYSDVLSHCIKSIDSLIGYESRIYSLLMLVCDSKDLGLLTSYFDCIINALNHQSILNYLISNNKLFDFWKATFIINGTVNDRIGSRVIDSIKNHVISFNADVNNFLDKALDLLNSYSGDKGKLFNSICFISLFVKNQNCGDFLSRFIPFLTNFINDFPKLDFFESIFSAKLDCPTHIWLSLSSFFESGNVLSNTTAKFIQLLKNCDNFPGFGHFRFESLIRFLSDLDDSSLDSLYFIISRINTADEINFLCKSIIRCPSKNNLCHALKQIECHKLDQSYYGLIIDEIFISLSVEEVQNILKNKDVRRIYYALFYHLRDHEIIQKVIRAFFEMDCETNTHFLESINKLLLELPTANAVDIILWNFGRNYNSLFFKIVYLFSKDNILFNLEFIAKGGYRYFDSLVDSEIGLKLIDSIIQDGPYEEVDEFFGNNLGGFKKLPQNILKKLAYGTLNRVGDLEFIRFPSLLPLIEEIEINNPLDMLLLKKHVHKDSEIYQKYKNLCVSQTLTYEEACEVKDNPSLLYDALNLYEPHRDCLMFHVAARDCVFVLNGVQSLVSFWFFAYHIDSDSEIVIAQYSSHFIKLTKNCISVFGQSNRRLVKRKWYNVTIYAYSNVLGENIIMCYIDGENVAQIRGEKPDSIIFGSFKVDGIWLLSTYILNKDESYPYNIERFCEDCLLLDDDSTLTFNSGVKLIKYHGFLRFIDVFGGYDFIFDRLICCSAQEEFILYIKCAINMLNLSLIKKDHFIMLMRYVIANKSDIISQKVFNEIIMNFIYEDSSDYKHLLQILGCYRILANYNIDFCFVENLMALNFSQIVGEDSHTAELFFISLLETFIFFEISDNAQIKCVKLIEHLVDEYPNFLMKIGYFIIGSAFFEDDNFHPEYLTDLSSIDKQLKLFDIFSSSKHFDDVIDLHYVYDMCKFVNLLLFVKILDFIADKSIDNDSYYSYEDMKSIQPILMMLTDDQDLWLILFKIGTKVRCDEIVSYATYQFVRKEMIHICLELCNSFMSVKNDKMCFNILQILFGAIHFSFETVDNWIDGVSSLCSLGTNMQPENEQPSFFKEKNLELHKKIIGYGTKRNSPNSFLGSSELKAKLFENLDSNLSKLTQEFLYKDNIKNEGIEAPIYTFDCVNDEKEILETTCAELIISEAVSYILNTLTLDYKEFSKSLIRLTCFSSDFSPSICEEMHRRIVILFLSSVSDISTSHLAILMEFITCRIHSGWWNDHINTIFNLVVNIFDTYRFDDHSHVILEMFSCFVNVVLKKISSNNHVSTFLSRVIQNKNSDHFLSHRILLLTILLYSYRYIDLSPENEAIFVESTLKKSSEDDIKLAYKDGTLKKLFDSNHFDYEFSRFFETMEEMTRKSNEIIEKSRLKYAKKPLRQGHSFFFKECASVQTTFRKVIRYQFALHFNHSSYHYSKSADILFKYSVKQKLNSSPPKTYMFGSSVNPLSAPVKYTPCTLHYRLECKRVRVEQPSFNHKQWFLTKIPIIQVASSTSSCYSDVNLPSYFQVDLKSLAMEVFNAKDEPANVDLVLTPENINCVLLQSKTHFHVILNSTITDDGRLILHDEYGSLSNVFVFDAVPYGFFGESSLFFTHPVISCEFSQVSTSFLRTFAYRHVSIELFFVSGTSFILVMDERVRKTFSSKVESNRLDPTVDMNYKGPYYFRKFKKIEDATNLWIDKKMDSYDYLLALNIFGGRSFNDFSQYHVFPWVISGYNGSGCDLFRDLSKPLGAIGESRLSRNKKSFDNLEKEYYYGTHYSNPAIVLHYMMRIEPFTLYNVSFHSGFDHSDRLFCSLEESYKSCTEMDDDFRELIPQFFCSPTHLININKIPLSARTDGTGVSTVKLPGWAKSPDHFIWKNRESLECNSSALNNWIDLIFGYKQKGKDGIEAQNIFKPSSYEDIANTTDRSSWTKADIDQVINFGQCPHQLFQKSHPCVDSTIKKLNIFNTNCINANLEANFPTTKNLYVLNKRVIASTKFNHFIKDTQIQINERVANFGTRAIVSNCFYRCTDSCLSKDLVFLAVSSAIGSVTVLSTQFCRIVMTASVPFARFNKVGVSSHFSSVAVSSDDALYLFDIGSGLLCQKVDVDGIIIKIVFDETHNLIIFATAETIYIYTLTLVHVYTLGIDKQVTDICLNDDIFWTPDVHFVTGHSDGSVLSWKFNLDKLNISKEKMNLLDLGSISSICIFDYGKAMVVVDESGKTILRSVCERSDYPLESSCFEGCVLCKSPLNNKFVYCSKCRLPYCRSCVDTLYVCKYCSYM